MPIDDMLNKGAKVLDVGCGPGAWMKDVATLYPNSQFVGVDMSESLFEGVEVLHNMSFTTGNCEKVPDNTFDAVYQRLMVFAIRKDEWDNVIRELVRVTKPGGYIELVEIGDGNFDGPIPNMIKLWQGVVDLMEKRSIDLKIADKLQQKIADAGMKFIQSYTCSFPIGWDGQLGELQKVNMQGLYAGLKPLLLKVFNLSEEIYDKTVLIALDEATSQHCYSNSHAFVGKVLK
ncbi:hypothetical protein HK096_008352 [Nowakowskiella sp. JEL0078]|nr:hypothetical protein HK096_008352 [Nowakowskiella sp. JEL0078]